MKICLGFIAYFFYTYTYILRKRKHCQDYNILINRDYTDATSNSSENADSILEKDSSNKQLCKEPLDLRIDDPELKRSNQNLKDIYFIKKAKKDEELTEVIIKKDNIQNEPFDTQLIEVYNSAGQSYPERKQYLSFSHINNLYSIIEQYIKGIMTTTYSGYYLIRISKIYQTYKMLTVNIEKIETHKHIFIIYDPKITNILESVCSQFKISNCCSEIDCDNFLKKLFDIIESHEDLRPLLNQLEIMYYKNRFFLFYAELMKCSKYFYVIPELITLGGIFADNSTYNLILSIHLINLLFETKKQIDDIKVFSFFLIRQSFTNSFKNRFNFPSIQTLRLKCTRNNELLHHNNLHFFLWEVQKNKRASLLVKLNSKATVFLSEVDKIHCKTVLIIFIFQQMIFLKLNNVVLEESQKYIELIHEIITEGHCLVCDLKRYLELLKKQN